MTEAIANLALSLVSNPGAYVLLLGSGISRAAGIPTGWEVVLALITRLAVASGEQPPADPAAWYQKARGREPTYTSVIEEVAPLAAERLGLLKGFFEATPEERERGLKQPTRAHRAIADLAEVGVVRVVVTTNFDRLTETALREAGIEPTVVSSDDDLAGVPPLTQVRCLVVKAHGDYLDTRIRNTADEVASLEPGVAAYLEDMFREYGLIVAGWSADFDAGLRGVMRSAGAGRYSAHWTSRSGLGTEAAALATDLHAGVVRIRDADSFFAALLEAVRSVQTLIHRGPLGDALAVATAKRLLASPEGFIPLGDLLSDAVERARQPVEASRPTRIESAEDFRDWLRVLSAGAHELVRIYATVGFWGRKEHAELLVRGLERLTGWGVEGGIVVVLESRVYPALLALYGAGVAAVAARNFAMLSRLLRCRLPHTEGRLPGDDDTLSAPRVLSGPKVLDHNATAVVLNIGAERRAASSTPGSVWLQAEVRPLLADVVPGDAEFERAFDTFEALLAARYVADGGRGVPTGQYAYRGHRNFVGKGVPERLLAELERDGPAWGPVAGGIFDSAELAREALEGLQARLAEFQFD